MLLLPGGWCTAVFYEELMAEPTLAGVRLVAVTLPGNGGTPAPEDVNIENYSRLTSELAADLGCDVIVGHSMGANVALEMAGSGAFSGRSCCWRRASPVRTRPWRSALPTGSPASSETCPSPSCGG